LNPQEKKGEPIFAIAVGERGESPRPRDGKKHPEANTASAATVKYGAPSFGEGEQGRRRVKEGKKKGQDREEGRGRPITDTSSKKRRT